MKLKDPGVPSTLRGMQTDPFHVAMKKVSVAVGDFIRYWGFRRIHGEIWTQLYLSSKPLSGADLVHRLNLSKALVNPALHELEAHGLIFLEAEASDDKTKRYSANTDVYGVIKNVLQDREFVLIHSALREHKNLSELSKKDPRSEVDPERLKSLGKMMDSALFSVSILQKLHDLTEIPQVLKFWKK